MTTQSTTQSMLQAATGLQTQGQQGVPSAVNNGNPNTAYNWSSYLPSVSGNQVTFNQATATAPVSTPGYQTPFAADQYIAMVLNSIANYQPPVFTPPPSSGGSMAAGNPIATILNNLINGSTGAPTNPGTTVPPVGTPTTPSTPTTPTVPSAPVGQQGTPLPGSMAAPNPTAGLSIGAGGVGGFSPSYGGSYGYDSGGNVVYSGSSNGGSSSGGSFDLSNALQGLLNTLAPGVGNLVLGDSSNLGGANSGNWLADTLRNLVSTGTGTPLDADGTINWVGPGGVFSLQSMFGNGYGNNASSTGVNPDVNAFEGASTDDVTLQNNTDNAFAGASLDFMQGNAPRTGARMNSWVRGETVAEGEAAQDMFSQTQLSQLNANKLKPRTDPFGNLMNEVR